MCLRKRKFVVTTDSDHGLPVVCPQKQAVREKRRSPPDLASFAHMTSAPAHTDFGSAGGVPTRLAFDS